MTRLLIFIYGIAAYTIGMAGLTWFILFVGGWGFLPHHIDSGSAGDATSAILINLLLVILFGLQHSLMARSAFKAWLTCFIAPATERSTYCLLSGIALILICLYWQPMNGYLWQADSELLRYVLLAGYLFGWAMSALSTFLINHFELFGLQQVYFNLLDKEEPHPHFKERWFYKLVRHPIQLGVMIGLWCAPEMSMSHLLLAVTLSLYILIGLYFEERDLTASLGDDYRNYQRRVRMLVPFPK